MAGKAPELWDAVSGSQRFAAAYTEADGRTSLPLEFAPCGSWFVVFREPAENASRHGANQQPRSTTTLSELSGPWQVTFDPQWGGPGTVEFPDLVSWPERDEPGIKFYSGTAVYRKTFELPDAFASFPPDDQRLWLDLGNVRELAEVKVNGQSCGIVWSPPFRVDISGAVKPGANQLEIEVVNFWPNRIIGDDALPPEQRLNPNQHPQAHQRHQADGIRSARAGHVTGSDHDPRPEEGNAMNNSSTGSCAKAPLSRRAHESTHRMLNPR